MQRYTKKTMLTLYLASSSLPRVDAALTLLCRLFLVCGGVAHNRRRHLTVVIIGRGGAEGEWGAGEGEGKDGEEQDMRTVDGKSSAEISSERKPSSHI